MQIHEMKAGRVEQAKKSKTLSGLGGRGSSVNFQKIKSAALSVAHASREVPPTYLLPDEKSHGAHVLIDDNGEVSARLEHKMSLASGRAKATKDFSPLWEGVINLPEPSEQCTVDMQKTIVLEWCKRFEAMTGHQVLRADLHLDEGHIDDHGEARLNAHAHVMADRTNDKGRVIEVSAPLLRKIQDMTAEVTGLARGENSLKSGRKHVGHQAFRYLAERGRLDPDHAKETDELKAEIERLKAEYAADREAMKATAEAKQRDYQALKEAHLKALAELKILKAPPAATEAEKRGAASVMVLVGQLQGAKLPPEKIGQIVERYTTPAQQASYAKTTEAEREEGYNLLTPEDVKDIHDRTARVKAQEFGRDR